MQRPLWRWTPDRARIPFYSIDGQVTVHHDTPQVITELGDEAPEVHGIVIKRIPLGACYRVRRPDLSHVFPQTARVGGAEALPIDSSVPRACLPIVEARVQSAQALWGLGWRSIQDVPNLSLSIAKRDAKNVSCIGMKI